MGLLDTSRRIVSLWADSKIRQLQTSKPNTKVDSGGTIDQTHFRGQDISRSELRDVKEMRESGGVVSHLVHAKALMQFGTGVEFQSDDDALTEFLEETFPNIDNTVIALGEDALWYPYATAELVETQGGDFSHVEGVEPWTMLPQTDEFGDVLAWEQEIRSNGTRQAEVFGTDDIASFILNKASARDKTGISEVLRAEDEIMSYRKNAKAIDQAVEVAAYPHHIWKVGREGGQVIDDTELRRVRNLVDNMEGDTQFVMGRDVEHKLIEGTKFDFDRITEHDLRKLALALGLPLELANVGSDGLGSGMPADLRLTLFERQARAAQRSFADQFVEQVIRPVLGQYSEFPRDADVSLRFGDPIAEREESSLQDIAPYLTLNEIREELDKEPEEDEELGGSYRKPANIEAPEQEEPEDSGGIGGFFGDEDTSADVALADGGHEAWEEYMLSLHRRVWDAPADRNLVGVDDHDVPEFVKERLKDAIRGGAVFSHFENVPSSELMQLRQFLTEQLEDNRWNIDGIANRLQDLDADLSFEEAERIARTETAATVNRAREIGYEEKGQGDDKFYWTGGGNPFDGRQTDACEWLIRETNPNYGGTPVSKERLKELIAEAPEHDPEMDDNLARPDDFVVHPNERKTWVRFVPG